MQNIQFEEGSSIYYFQIKEMSELDRCLKETLRLRPPIMTMMRMAKVPVVSMHLIRFIAKSKISQIRYIVGLKMGKK